MENIKKYINDKGYGTGTTFTTSTVASLIKSYHSEKNKQIVKQIEERIIFVKKHEYNENNIDFLQSLLNIHYKQMI
jgi:hypothetical protein